MTLEEIKERMFRNHGRTLAEDADWLIAGIEKYQAYFKAAEFENLDKLYAADKEFMVALGEEIARRSKALIDESVKYKTFFHESVKAHRETIRLLESSDAVVVNGEGD